MKAKNKKREVLSSVFDRSNKGLYIYDSNMKVVCVNKMFTEMTGYDESEILGKSTNVLKSGVHNEGFYREIDNCLSLKGNWKGEIWNKKKGGELHKKVLNITKEKHPEGTMYFARLSNVTEKEELLKDVAYGAEIQESLLPDDINEKNLKVKTIYKPSHLVSGDFYDFIYDEKRNKFSGYIIDVMGHGLSTALQTSALRILIFQAFDRGYPLKKVLEWVNDKALRYFPEHTFGAAICFEFDLNTRKLTYATAGVDRFIHLSRVQNKIIKIRSSFLGITNNVEFEEGSMNFSFGDSFVFCSDGVMEVLENDSIIAGKNFEDLYRCLDERTNKEPKDDCTAICISFSR